MPRQANATAVRQRSFTRTLNRPGRFRIRPRRPPRPDPRALPRRTRLELLDLVTLLFQKLAHVVRPAEMPGPNDDRGWRAAPESAIDLSDPTQIAVVEQT